MARRSSLANSGDGEGFFHSSILDCPPNTLKAAKENDGMNAWITNALMVA
jgi:hypothetical protein